jgi:putative ABC transport system permease protein
MALRQWISAIELNLAEMPSRPGQTLVTIAGFAAVTGVLVAVLAIAAGYRNAFGHTGAANVALIMNQRADSPLQSQISTDALHTAEQAPEVARSKTGSLVAPELLTTVPVTHRHTGASARVLLRGATSELFGVHSRVHLVAGRRFKTGLNELIVGQSAAARFKHMKLGDKIKVEGKSWTVVGIFSAPHSIYDSEAWADLGALQDALKKQNNDSAALAKLTSPAAFDAFKQRLEKTPGLNVKVDREDHYYTNRSSDMAKVIHIAGGLIALLMGIAAIFGAMSTLYTVVANRAAEIGVLRAIGFGRLAVLGAVLAESLVLGLIGGVIGAGLAYAFFNGFQASTLNASQTVTNTTPQVAFAFAVTPIVMAIGVAWALVMGFIGGFFPAVRAARLPVAKALREV